MRLLSGIILLGLLPAPLVWSQAFDRTVSASTQLRLQVVASCQFFNQQEGPQAALHFGEHASLTTHVFGQTPTNTSIRLRCSPATTYRITINLGQHGGDILNRRMAGSAGQSFINYQLFTNTTRTQVWDDVVGVTGQGTGTVQQYPVYGYIPPQQTPTAGLYSDQLVITVVW